ncbi:MAG: acetoacetate--CoA ligase, partial [Burkholderiaceae bacterium]
VASCALALRELGVARGDRVAAYMPNVPETVVAFLACASIGAVWSVCAPDMGAQAVLDRFKQIEPKVLIGCDGVHYAGKTMDRLATLQDMVAALPTLTHTVAWRQLGQQPLPAGWLSLNDLMQRQGEQVAAFAPEWLPFDHPLWIVYSSGTTGLPKPIVHGHGGTVLVALALKILHNDVGCSYQTNNWGERYHWYSSTGWVMWNAQVAGLLNGTTCVIFDGSPSGSKNAPDWGVLWRFAARHGVTFFGAGAAFFANCQKADLALDRIEGISSVRALGSTGSPLSEDTQNWGSAAMAKAGRKNVWWCNISGGTDFAGAFIGGNRELPDQPGRMQCRLLGCSVQSWSDEGQAVTDAVGELVCTQPIPSMPLYFWGDAEQSRYRASYFEHFAPGQGRQPGGGEGDPAMGAVWRHGDWLRVLPDGSCIIYGRSDATINRHGLRMGTSEIYNAVESLPDVLDSMVVDLEYLGRPSYMPLFVVLRPGTELSKALKNQLSNAIKTALSPRFVPDDIFSVEQIPRTLTGKKQELPIKKLMLGHPLQQVVNPETMANPDCLPWYQEFAQAHLAKHGGSVSS